jgi:hypothetical protein
MAANMKESTMPIENAVIIAAIVAAFLGFAVVLAWTEHQTRGMHDSNRRKLRGRPSVFRARAG